MRPEGLIASNIIRHRRDRARLIDILRDIQAQAGFISPEAVTEVAAGLGVSTVEVEGMAYRFQMLVPRFPFQFPTRKVEAAEKKILLEHNRCIKCLRCVRGVRTRDNKAVFGALRRSRDKKISVDQALASALSEKQARQAMDRCPVGSILKKEVGFVVPIGKRKYDKEPIDSDVEKAKG